jgi:hypothetical protein
MFPVRYFDGSYFAARYWPKVGATVVVVSGPYYIDDGQLFSAGTSSGQVYHAGASEGQLVETGDTIGEVI